MSVSAMDTFLLLLKSFFFSLRFTLASDVLSAGVLPLSLSLSLSHLSFVDAASREIVSGGFVATDPQLVHGRIHHTETVRFVF